MKRQLINLEQSMSRGDSPSSPWQRIRFWANDHLRLVWNLVMMAILFTIFIFVTMVSSANHKEGTIIENLAPELRRDVDRDMEEAVKRTTTP